MVFIDPIKTAIGLVVVLFPVFDGAEQVEDFHLLAATDAGVQSGMYGFLVSAVAASLASFLDQAIIYY